MTEAQCVVASCDRPMPRDQFMCRGCMHRLERRLGDVPALWQELTITMTRQDVVGTDGGRKSADTGLPYKSNASEARWVLANTVGTWARVMADHAGISQPPAKPARWLMLNVQSIAMHPAADEAYDEISEAVRQAYRAIDRVPDLLLAGKCDTEGCEKSLYARPGDETVTCQGCDREYLTAERDDAMMEAATDKPVTATLALAWLAKRLGRPIPGGTWRSWLSRNQILMHSQTIEGIPLYVFGDVRTIAEEWLERVVEREKKQGAKAA